MNFSHDEKVEDLRDGRTLAFLEEEVLPAEPIYPGAARRRARGGERRR